MNISSNDTVFYLLLSNLATFILFIFSECLAFSKGDANGVTQFVSKKLVCLGGRRIQIAIGLAPESNAGSPGGSATEESPLLQERAPDIVD